MQQVVHASNENLQIWKKKKGKELSFYFIRMADSELQSGLKTSGGKVLQLRKRRLLLKCTLQQRSGKSIKRVNCSYLFSSKPVNLYLQ